VHPSTLAAGFTFSSPSSWEDGPIEVRNFNRIRKVYSQLRDYCVVHKIRGSKRSASEREP